MPSVTDSLANERTFLAYARTALAFIAFGFVIARFSLFTREVSAVVHLKEASPGGSALFGTVMALAGVLCAAYGAYRYVATARALRSETSAPMPDQSAIAVSVAIGATGLVVMRYLFSLR